MGIERRRYQRVTIKSVAKIAVPALGAELFAFVGSISRGGLELYCQEPLPAGKPATIHLTFLNRQGETLKETLQGTIRWQAKLGEATIAGVEFSAPIEPQNHAALWAYLTPDLTIPDAD
ncbi:MAG: PilZ domain-containing protein [Nitrospirae bacterium]|nr:PilZ domain-containing protein [Nitrospirota bacterium]